MNDSIDSPSISGPEGRDFFLQIMLEKKESICQERLVMQRGCEDAQLLLQSRNGGDPRWPDSPPWQDTIVETREADQVLLAIGRAGRSHWSGSWTPARDDHGAGFDVEIACRVHEAPANLGTSWTAGAEVRVLQSEPGRVFLESGNARIALFAGPIQGILRVEAGANESVSVRWCQQDHSPLPSTIVYRYSIRLTAVEVDRA